METSVINRAKYAIVQRLLYLKGKSIFRSERPAYTILPEDNLVSGVTNEDFWDDLMKGDGNELLDSSKSPAKFCAAYSSSALVVNTFGPFRHSPSDLALADYSDFSEAQFERKCPTGSRGRKPNLDFLVSGPKITMALESKLLEIIRTKKPAEFKESYNSVIRTNADSAWQGMYKALLDNPTKFIHLDAAQLVKHYLGIRNTFRDSEIPKVFVYLFWEPTNSAEIPEYQEHRKEVTLFSRAVQESGIRFMALSYEELWQYWYKRSRWGGMSAHIEALRQRYELSI